MFDFLEIRYLNNTIMQWTTALLLIVLCIISGRILYLILSRQVKALTRYTETELDDIIIDMIEEPVAVIAVFLGIRLSINTLHIHNAILFWINSIFWFLVAIFSAWMIIRLIDSIQDYYGPSIQYKFLSRAFLSLCFILSTMYLIRYWIVGPERCYPDCIGVALIERNMTKVNLSETIMIDANLRGSDFSEANLSGVDLSGAMLVGVKLQRANLREANLIGANLTGADLRGAILSSTNLIGANLTKANLTKLNLTTTRLAGTDLTEAQLTQANLSDINLAGTNLHKANLTGAILWRTDLSGSYLSEANLGGADIRQANLDGAWLNMANLNGANIIRTSLAGASFLGSDLSSVNFSNSNLTGATLVGANLNGASLRGTILTDARLFFTDLDLQVDLSLDLVIANLKELERPQILKDASLGGLSFDDKTIWPKGKTTSLRNILGEQFATSIQTELKRLPSPREVNQDLLPPLCAIDLSQITNTFTISAAGSTTVLPITRRMGLYFETKYTSTLTLDDEQAGGTGEGFSLFCQNEVYIANASRRIKPEERRVCQGNRRDPIDFEIGTDTIVVVVNPTNDFLDDVSLDDLKKIFTASEWFDINRKWPQEDIIRFVPDSNSGTYDFFTEKVFADKVDRFRDAPNTTFTASRDAIIQGVATIPSAIGFIAYGDYIQNQTLLKRLTVNGVMPSVNTAQNRDYPLARSLYIYTDANLMREEPVLGAFINFYITYVNWTIKDVGYFPVSLDTVTQNKILWLKAMNPDIEASDSADLCICNPSSSSSPSPINGETINSPLTTDLSGIQFPPCEPCTSYLLSPPNEETSERSKTLSLDDLNLETDINTPCLLPQF